MDNKDIVNNVGSFNDSVTMNNILREKNLGE